MPIVFRDGNIRFHFYSNEGSPQEPIHIHADRGNAEAKLWLFPDVQIAESPGIHPARAGGPRPHRRRATRANREVVA